MGKLQMQPGDYASHIELKDGRKFLVLSHADGRVFRISEDAVEGGVTGEYVYEPGSEYFEKVLEDLHDCLLTTDLPEELGVPLAMKIPE